MSQPDQLLNQIAPQWRVAYAMQQLNICRAALQRWHSRPIEPAGPYNQTRAQHELTYYTQQFERWQAYLDGLRENQRIVQQL